MHCQPEYKHQVYIWLKTVQICLICDEATESTHCVCNVCETELPWLLEHCDVCALPLPMEGLICGQCQKQPPAFKQVIAPWSYSFPIDSLISRFKHQARWPFGQMLARLLAQHLQHRLDNTELTRPDCLLPVPMARKRLRERGYNQALMLTRWLSSDLNLPHDEHLLLRPHDTVAQQALDAKTRKRNLLGAFALAPGAQVQGRHFALVDDVLTTGATAHSLAQLLMNAGARQVDVYCLARTPKPGS
ncbi:MULTISPECIES: ComF family protein [Pseudomonas]|uniref:ComF family protein n=1 Tax=Pseudomonas tritici TaxID=2745518 RepID=A0A8I0CWX8_9PSED|nr:MULTISPECIES: ComF family protein [Pseudomonas]MBP2871893.1 ComF family protein [Pseudomonas sp. SWRI144]QXH83588.1 ComF family protein [Pseudomonas tritici]CRM02551.1 DNA utilization protein GntX [Pseudomonas sp. 24 E 1]CRM04203.1 DNA utilization protein GntX [Pseudomonas sp. 52 E 6]CRM06331.1 DNA utilization protein GntX [Pseudomonas sp. 24 R 17]